MDEWSKIDLHIHTQVGRVYNNKDEAKDTGKYYSIQNLIERNQINNLKLISITNHNIINVVELLKAAYASKKYGTNIIPGIELDIFIHSETRYHIIVVFSESTDIISISNKLDEIIEKNNNNYLTLDDLFELIQNTECVIIPHGCKNPHGFKPTDKDEIDINDAISLVNIITGSASMNVLFEHTKPHFSESFKSNLIEKSKKMWLSVQEMEELEKRAGGEYVGSDYRFSVLPIKKEERILTKIWANPTFRGLQISCIFPSERIRAENNIVTRVNYLSKIEIFKSKFFSESTIFLSSGLNSIIGESASGKTALLDIITKRLKGIDAVKDKDYADLCKDLDAKFYNQDGYELKKGDINIVVAENLYDSIRSAHDTGDNKEILKLFNFTENSESFVIENYKKNLQRYIKNNNDVINSKKDGISNFTDIKERNNVLLFNSMDNNLEFIIDIPLFEEIQILKKYDEAKSLLIKYLSNFEQIKEETKVIKLKLLDLKISNQLEEKISEMMNEIIRIKKTVDKNLRKLQLKRIIFNKLSNIVSFSNNKINQKNAYIQNIKKKIYEDSESLINNIKVIKVNQMKNNSIDLDFPENAIINELVGKNKHQYIEVEYNNIKNLLNFDLDSGIFNIKGMKQMLSNFIGKTLILSTDIKNIINEIQLNGKIPLLRVDELVNDIIVNSKIKIGFPNSEKVLVSDLTPGLTAKMYIDYLFNVKILDGFNNIVIFDQPENDVDKAFIYDELIPKISNAKFDIQIIITSHEPLLVVNGDSNQIIKAEKNNKIISYKSYKLDEYLDANTVTKVISKYVDGNVNAVKNRYEIYVGGKNEISDIL